MGNPNRCPRCSITAITPQVSYRNEAIAAKTPQSIGKDKVSHAQSCIQPEIETQEATNLCNAKAVEGNRDKLRLSTTSNPLIKVPAGVRVTNSPAFKSYKTGTLDVPVFTSGCAIIPFPSPKPFSLNAESPSFVYWPSTFPAPSHIVSTRPQQLSNGTQLSHTKNQPISFTKNTYDGQFQACMDASIRPRGFLPVTDHRSFDQSIKSPRPRRISGAPLLQQQELSPYSVPATATSFAKSNKLSRDIVISSDGLQCNIAQVTEVYFRSGAALQTTNTEANDTNPTFSGFLAQIDHEEQTDLLRKCNFEILVGLLSQEDEEVATKAKNEAPKLISIEETPNYFKSAMISSNPVILDWEAAASAIITVLQSLPTNVLDFTEKLTVTLQFPRLPDDPTGQIQTPIGPRKLPPSRSNITRGNSTHAVPEDTSYQKAVNFLFVAKVVSEVYRFKALKKLDVVLAPPSNMRTPMTLPQLNCVLPFYDLDFTDWKLWWQTDFMSKPEPLRFWPLDYLNRERDRICFERMQKLRDLRLGKSSVAVTSSTIN